MSPDDRTGNGGDEATPERPDSEPLADEDAGVAVDDDPTQVDLNSDQWDTE
jgi:hypothetical protein